MMIMSGDMAEDWDASQTSSENLCAKSSAWVCVKYWDSMLPSIGQLTSIGMEKLRDLKEQFPWVGQRTPWNISTLRWHHIQTLRGLQPSTTWIGTHGTSNTMTGLQMEPGRLAPTNLEQFMFLSFLVNIPRCPAQNLDGVVNVDKSNQILN